MRQLLLSTAVLLACAATAPAMAQDAPAAAQAAPAETAAPAQAGQAPAQTGSLGDRVAPPPAGKGQVIFFRQSKFAGAALSFSVREGDTGIGKLGNGGYFVQVTDPGTHTYTVQSEAKDSLTLEVEAGETYYVKNSIGMGVMMARPHLAPAAKEEFDASKLKLSTKKPSDLKPAS